jgi:aspartate ammonia-lyase
MAASASVASTAATTTESNHESAQASSRREHDLLGERDVPETAYWGVHTLRALENFSITGQPIGSYRALVRGLVAVKRASAVANGAVGILDPLLVGAICTACDEILDSDRFDDQFVVDLIQGGAGTSSNMNANEVIANLALESMGRPKGDYGSLHPVEHVNMSQSTNDVYPTALKVALIESASELAQSMAFLRDGFSDKARENDAVLKVGRTQLQDAVPMTVGQELRTYAVMLEEDIARLGEATRLLHEVNLGATAIGTGLNAPEAYSALAVTELARIAGIPVVSAGDLVEATQDVGAFVQFSGVLKRIAVKLSKVCNDLRLLSSGPRAGFGELNLPAVQAGSSIMPGKVNPVIPEVVNQVAFEVIGHDLTVTMAAEGGQLQLNAFEPIMAKALLESLQHLSHACRVLRTRCVDGITVNRERLSRDVAECIGLATALNPRLGYEVATSVALEALRTGRGVADVVLARGLLESSQLERLLSPSLLANLRVTGDGQVGLDPASEHTAARHDVAPRTN